MIIAKTNMEYLPSSCRTCNLHTENYFEEHDKTIACPITKEFAPLEELKLSKKLRNCPLIKQD